MFVRYFGDEMRFETIRECLEHQIKEQEIHTCIYYFNVEGNCGYYIYEGSRGHLVEPSDMLRIAEKFFNEFGWVHFEGIGKNGEAYVDCYKAEETQEDFIKRRVEEDKKIKHEKILKCNEMRRNGATKEEATIQKLAQNKLLYIKNLYKRWTFHKFAI